MTTIETRGNKADEICELAHVQDELHRRPRHLRVLGIGHYGQLGGRDGVGVLQPSAVSGHHTPKQLTENLEVSTPRPEHVDDR